MSHIGLKIKHAREQRGLTQKQLAESIHKTRPLISQIEQTGMVNNITLVSILGALGLKMEELVNGRHEPDYRFWLMNEETKRLKAEIEALKTELNSAKELAATQRSLIMMLEKALGGISS